MKKAFLSLFLIPLCAFEIYLSTTLLPLRWQHELNAAVIRLLPHSHDWTPVTHPMLEQEIEGVLSEHLWIKVSLYGITLLLLAINGWAIYRLIKLVRSEPHVR
jgi:hypothetical protein